MRYITCKHFLPKYHLFIHLSMPFEDQNLKKINDVQLSLISSMDVPCGVASKKSLCNEMLLYIALLGFFI